MATDSDNNVFDEVMEQVGNSGRFQKIYNIIFNLFFVSAATMATFNVIICLAIPNHWCKVPGREATNFTAEQWRNLTIPWKSNTSNEFSRCSMFNKTDYTIEGGEIVECAHGWEYDQTYYIQTITTQESWVCSQEMYATNFLVFGKIGEIVGTIISQLGDVYGRRPILYASIVTIVIGRLGLIFSRGIYVLYIIFSIMGNLPSISLYQAPLVISMEISSIEDRTMIPLLQCVGWTLGICVAPMIFWVLGEWISFTLVTTLPTLLFLFIPTYMIESPRWLAGKGKMKECIRELKKIAKSNKTEITDKVLMSLNAHKIVPEKNYGAMSLFASWNLAKNSIHVIIGWICYMIIYVILFLNVSNLKGNPFLNYLYQGLAELPGYFVGKYLTDSIGRKFTKLLAFIAMGIASVALAFVLIASGHEVIISVSGVALKFFSSIVFYAINLQTLELYPTVLRQTGYSMGFLVASVFGIFTPYIVLLGISVNPSYPYIISAGLALLGGVSGMFLPETLNEKLPETISEAEQFGADQKLWSLPKRKNCTHKIVSSNDA